MASQRPPYLHFLVLLVAAVLMWQVWTTRGEPTDLAGDGDGAGAATSGLDAGPELATSDGAKPAGEATPEAAPPGPDEWIIEVVEIARTDGNPSLGAAVFTDRTEESGDTYAWDGSVLRIRLENPGTGETEAAEQADPRVFLSIYCEGCARWFSPPLRPPPNRVTTIRAQLEPSRVLRGVVLAPGGRNPPESPDPVQVTRPGIPASIFSEGAFVDRDGTFEFDPETLPSGPLVIRASVDSPYPGGWPVEAEVGPAETDVTLVLGRTHRFRFRVAFDEAEDATGFVRRSVLFRPADPEDSLREPFQHEFEVTRDPSGPTTDWGPHDARLVLPEGRNERWEVEAPGYRTVDLTLSATGPLRDHDVVARLRPHPRSGVLAANVGLPWARAGQSIHLEANPRADGDLSSSVWMAAWQTAEGRRTRGSVRIPADGPIWVRIGANLYNGKSYESWTVDPSVVSAAPGETIPYEVDLVRSEYLVIKCRPHGAPMPELRVRLRREGHVLELDEWVGARRGGKAPIYELRTSLGWGRWTVEVLHDGKLLPWTGTLEVKPALRLRLDLPDLEELLAGK